MIPLCAAEGVGVIPWSPLARGRLARPWGEVTDRSEIDGAAHRVHNKDAEADRRIVQRVAEIAESRGVSMPQVALAWLMAKPAVNAPIVGLTRPHHLEDAIAATAIALDPLEIEQLEASYVPRPFVF